MKKIVIQFHASPEELVEYINSVSSELGLVVTMMILKPFKLKEIEGQLSVGDLMLDGDIRIIFTKEKPNIAVASPNNFYDLNPGVVHVDIGRLTTENLKESALSFMSDDKEKIDIANKLASRLKKITKAGVIAVSSISGAEANVRSHRYTKGAKSMYDLGINMLPIAGNSFYKLLD